MSDLWNVSVIEKVDTTVKFKVLGIHEDAGFFPDDPVFAMMLLTKTAYEFNNQYERVACSLLGEQIDFDKSYHHSDLAEVYKDYIAEHKVCSAKNFRDEDAVSEYVSRKLAEAGIEEEDSCYDEKYEDFYCEYSDDPNNVPTAVYQVEVTDAKWLDHLSVGKKFNSTAYSETGPFVEEEI